MIGLLDACALLLGVAGVAKMLRPAPTVQAARRLQLTGVDRFTGAAAARSLGAVEIAVALAVLLAGGARAAAALAVAYLLLTAVAVRLLRVAPDSDCGCFGTSAEPVSRLHVVVNAACALVAGIAVVVPQPSLPVALAGTGAATGASLVVLIGVLAALLGALMTAMPALTSARAKVATPR